MTFAPRTIVESSEYTKQVETIGGAPRIDDALGGIVWALSRRPEAFDEVPGYPGIRIAKTDQRKAEGGTIVPRLRVWFRISDDDSTVELLYIEAEDLDT